MLLKITLPLTHVNVSPRTESGWTRKNTDCCEQVRANTTIEPARGRHRSAGKFRPQRLHLLVLQRRSHIKYRRMHHTRSPLSGTACRLLLNKLHVGESSPSSVDLSSQFQCILELARAEYPELNVEHNSYRSADCQFVVARAPRSRNNTSRIFKFSNMLDFAVCMRCMPSRRLRRLDKP